MLIRSSGFIQPGFAVLSMGQSYTYAVVSGAGRIALFDPGLPSQLELLTAKLNECGISWPKVTDIFITHLHPERIGAIPWIREQSPTVSVWSSPENKRTLDNLTTRSKFIEEIADFSKSLPQSTSESKFTVLPERFAKLLQIDLPCVESDTINLGNEIFVRGILTPGHTAGSIAYLVSPFQYLVVDEGFGYFNGRNFATPGGDFSVAESLKSILKTKDLDLTGLCFTNTGMITGALVGKHVTQILQNSDDLVRESVAAIKSGTPPENIRQAIQNSFFYRESPDPILARSLERSLNAIWDQVLKSSSKVA